MTVLDLIIRLCAIDPDLIVTIDWEQDGLAPLVAAVDPLGDDGGHIFLGFRHAGEV